MIIQCREIYIIVDFLCDRRCYRIIFLNLLVRSIYFIWIGWKIWNVDWQILTWNLPLPMWNDSFENTCPQDWSFTIWHECLYLILVITMFSHKEQQDLDFLVFVVEISLTIDDSKYFGMQQSSGEVILAYFKRTNHCCKWRSISLLYCIL